jgi:hypothetical protein
MKILAHPLLDPYLGWPVVLDSNLLLLHWCSSFDPSLIRTFKRLNAFEPNDLYVLAETLAGFGELQTTPHVLTEVSNLASSLPSWRKPAWSVHISGGIALIPEFYEPAAQIMADQRSSEFGLTDAALVRLAAEHVILTIDWRLASMLNSRGLAGINFKHLRPGRDFVWQT